MVKLICVSVFYTREVVRLLGINCVAFRSAPNILDDTLKMYLGHVLMQLVVSFSIRLTQL